MGNESWETKTDKKGIRTRIGKSYQYFNFCAICGHAQRVQHLSRHFYNKHKGQNVIELKQDEKPTNPFPNWQEYFKKCLDEKVPLTKLYWANLSYKDGKWVDRIEKSTLYKTKPN